jgi:fructose-specific phosphotransferase system IIC component
MASFTGFRMLWFILTCYGLTQILVYGSVFNKVRPKHRFFHCPMCIGFWVGVLVCLISPWTELFTFERSLTNLFLCGWLSSGTSYALCMVINDEGINFKRN